MVTLKNKKYSLFVLFIITCHFSKAQNNENIYKSMIRESFNFSEFLLDEQSLKISEEINNPDSTDSTTINQSLKKKLLLHSKAYYMYDNSELAKDFDKFQKENPYLNVPKELTKGYTNYKQKFDETYDYTPVFVDGRWVAKSSLAGVSTGGGFSPSELIKYLKSQTPKEKRKKKALKVITEIIYPTE